MCFSEIHNSPIAKHSCVRGPSTHVWIATGSHDALRIPTSTSFEWHIRRCVSNASSPLDVITNEIKARRRSIVILIYLRITKIFGLANDAEIKNR